MASSIISGAISIMLILLTGYVIASGILSISQSMLETQTDVSALDEQILHSNIQIINYSTNSKDLSLEVKNTGETSYSVNDLNKIDLYLLIGSIQKLVPTHKLKSETDLVNKEMWDPGEILYVNYTYISTPVWARIVTSNGITSSIILNIT
jgi:hypothetical protein